MTTPITLVSLIARRFSATLRTGFPRFTTFVAVGSVALGCLALIVAISVLDGYEELIMDTALRSTAHIEIRSLDRRPPAAPSPLASVAADVATIPGVQRVETVLVQEALARTRTGIEGVMIYGVSNERLSMLTGTAVHIDTVLTELPAAWIGRELARTLGCELGDTVVLYAASADGTTPTFASVRVGGMVSTGMHRIDASIIAMRLSSAATALRAHTDHPSQLQLTVDDPEQAGPISAAIPARVDPSLLVLTWQDRFQAIASWIELQQRPIPIILGLISIVAMFTVASTLLVSVVEKTRSIAILLTLGMSPRAITRVVALRGLTIAALGSGIGAVLAFLFAVVQRTWQPIALDGAVYFVTALPVSLSPLPYIIVPGIALLLALVASVIPAALIRRVQPVTALRFS